MSGTKLVQSTEVIRESGNVRVRVLRLSPDAKRGLSTQGAGLLEASAQDIERLMRAISVTGQRVEILPHAGHPSASLAAASESARRAAQLNALGTRVARIVDASKGRRFECGVSAEQARELLKAGAIEK